MANGYWALVEEFQARGYEKNYNFFQLIIKVKATYCTLSNMKDKIRNHNGKVLSKKSEVVLDANGNVIKCCSDQPNCPTKPDWCDQAGVIYQADVHAENTIMTYYGSTVRQFKKRYSEKIPKCHTTLSSHIWRLKDKNISYKVKWSIKARGHAFSSGGRACNLCLPKNL